LEQSCTSVIQVMGRPNLLVRYLNQGRADAGRPHIAPRNAAQILLTRPDDLTNGQRETAARLASACPEMKALASLIRSFAAMLDPYPTPETRKATAVDQRRSHRRTASPALFHPRP
jgi:hypothetical protein